MRFAFLFAIILNNVIAQSSMTVFSVKTFGAVGDKLSNDQRAIQKTIDACSAAGGGMVYLPPGKYLSGTLYMRSHVRFHIEAGAILFSIKEKEAFTKDALIYGEDLENISIEGRGTIDGQGAYEWDLHMHEDDFIRSNMEMMQAQGKPLLRSFPKKDQFGKLILLLRCKDVLIRDLSLIDSPSWTIHPYGCERLTIDGVYIKSSLKEGVWADGIDPDGCKDVRISNCTIETGDDALVFYSMNWFGPALPCENITVTNCRLTSSSSAIKFCDGNMNAIRNVTISNCMITNSNRGIAFMNFDGGVVEDIIISDVTIECVRKDWFWWGDGDPLHFNIKRRSEVHKSIKPEDDKNPAGKIRRVQLNNIIARGYGSSICNGHPNNWLEDITINNLKLYLRHDASAQYDKAVHALTFQYARNLKLSGVEIFWEDPGYKQWQSALKLQDINGVELNRFAASQSQIGNEIPVIEMINVKNAWIKNSNPILGTKAFIKSDETTDINFQDNNSNEVKPDLKQKKQLPSTKKN